MSKTTVRLTLPGDKKRPTGKSINTSGQLCLSTACSISYCLTFLREEAQKIGLHRAAKLINDAEASITASIHQEEGKKSCFRKK